MLLISLFSEYESVTIVNERLNSFNEGWTYNDKSIILPLDLDSKKDSQITIKNRLPELRDGSNLFFYSENNDICIYIEETLIYDFGTNTDYLFSDNPGFSYHIIPIQKPSEGKEITVQFTYKTNTSAGFIPSFAIGNTGAVYQKIISENVFYIISASLIFVTSIFFIFQSLLLYKKVENVKGIFYLGICGIIFASLILANSGIWQFFGGNSFFMYYTSSMVIMLLPLAFLLSVRNLIKIKNFCVFDSIIIISLLNIIISTILEITGTLTFADSIISSHFINIASVFAVYYVLLIKNVECIKTLKYGLILFSTSILIDVSLRLFILDARPFISIVGIIIFLFFIGKKVLDQMSEEIIEGKRYKDMAYHDALTGAYTLMALNENIEALEKECNYGVAIFDLNNLKYYNDKFGHSVGDYIISTAVEILYRAFNKYKYVYRTGGDEFLIVMPDVKEDEFKVAINKLTDLQKSASTRKVIGGESIVIDIAYGFAICNNESFDAVKEKADLSMYSNKEDSKTSN